MTISSKNFGGMAPLAPSGHAYAPTPPIQRSLLYSSHTLRKYEGRFVH